MSFQLSIHGHSDDDADTIKAAVAKAFDALAAVGASSGSLSGTTTEGEPFSVSYPEVAPGSTTTKPEAPAAEADAPTPAK